MKGCELGAVDYVTKSFNATELLRRVHTHLQLSFLQQDLARQVEEQTARRLQAQKIGSMGQLATGIAHEVNTPMQYINNNTDFLQQTFEEFGEVIDKYHAFYQQAAKGSVDEVAIHAVATRAQRRRHRLFARGGGRAGQDPGGDAHHTRQRFTVPNQMIDRFALFAHFIPKRTRKAVTQPTRPQENASRWRKRAP